MHALVVGLVAQVVLSQPPTGATFTLLNPSTKPSARRSTGLVEVPTSPSSSRLWALGGYTSTGSTSSTFAFDTATMNWASVATSGTPAGRDRHGLGWDPVRARLVMFGGVKSSGPFSFAVTNETYALDPSTGAYTLLTNSPSPPAARADAGFVWVPSISKFLMFGGTGSYSGSSPKFNDLWTLEINTSTNQATWVQLAPSGTPPSARNAACVAFDPIRNKLIVFGGEAVGGAVLGGTFQYDVASNAWTTDSPTGTIPSNRSFSGCAWDPQLEVVVLYGGWDGSSFFGGTYFYDPVAKAWSTLAPSPNPGNLSDVSATFSTVLDKTVFFGGQSSTSSYTNNTWTLTLVGGANLPPIANAGTDQLAPEAAPVMLNGSASSDPEAAPLTYQWTQTGGPAVTLSSSSAASPSFTSPSVLNDTPLTFSLVVNDGTNPSPPDTVVITVQDSINEPPLADAGGDQNVAAGAVVSLNGSGSDPNGEALSYAWTQIGGSVVTVSGGSTATPTFTAPTSSSGAILTFRLTVTDARMGSDTDDVVVTVAANVPPVADAGMDLTVNEASSVALSGSGSDFEGQPLTYQWAQTGGPAVTLSSSTVAAPTFLSPTVTAQTTLTFALMVTDGAASSAPDVVNVIVQDSINELPTANAGPDQTVSSGAAVNLSGSGSDPNGEALTYAWTQVSGPSVTLTSPASASSGFTAPASASGAVLTFSLLVTDARMGSDTDEVTITVSANAPPAADAGPDQTVDEQATATLDGSASTDPELDALTFSWTQTAGPAVALVGATSATPSFPTPMVTQPVQLSFQVTVSDGLSSSNDSVTVTIADSINEPPVVDAGPDQTVGYGALVTLDGSTTQDPNGEALTYAWTQVQGNAVTSSTPSAASTQFTAGAVDEVLRFRLTATDARNGSSFDEVTITVVDVPPVPPTAVALATPPSGDAPLATTLDGTQSTAGPGRALLRHRWTPGDGSLPVEAASVAHSYALPGGYNAELLVEDDQALTDSAKVQVSVGLGGVLPPVASIVLAPASGPAPLNVALSCACSDPQGLPLSYAWDFGDGASSNEPAPTHAFANAGTYAVRLSVGNGQLTTTDSAFVVVTGAVGAQPPVARLFASPSSGVAPLTVSFTTQAADPDGSVVSRQLLFPDGSTLEAEATQRSFAEPGRYTVRLTVTDDDGLTATDAVEVVVTGADGKAPPRIVSRGARTARVGDAYVYDEDRRVEAVGEAPLRFAIASSEAADGVEIDSETGEVRWVPLRAGTARFVISVRTEGADAAAFEALEVEVEAIDARAYGVGCGCGVPGSASGAASGWLLAGVAALASLRSRRRRRGGR